MNKKTKTIIYCVWAGLYCLCAGLGFIPESQIQGVLKSTLTAISFIFFLPPFLLAWVATRREDRKMMKELRIISLIALFLCVTMIVLIFLSAAYFNPVAQKVTLVLYLLLAAPLQSSQYWFFPLFMWACLLMVTLRRPEPQ